MSPSDGGLAQLTFDKTGWGSPIASPDRRFVAAIRDRRLWIMRPDGRNRRLLALNAHGVSWSADSRRLALQVGLGVVTIARQGGDERWVSPGSYESWPSPSPHARAVAFLRDGRLVVHRKGRNRTLVPQASGGPAWSPDGKWIATVSGSGDAVELVRPTGGAPVVVARRVGGPAYGPTLAWSPDALSLAYADLDGIHVVFPSGGDARLLAAGPSSPLAWSPSGDAIAFVRGDGPALVTMEGAVRTLVAATGVVGVGWTAVRTGDRYHVPQLVRPGAPLVEVSQRELRSRVPIGAISADGDRVGYWLCPHVLGVWPPGDAEQIPLGQSTVETCALPSDSRNPGTFVYALTLAGDRLAYLTRGGSNTPVWELRLTTFERGDEGVPIVSGASLFGVDPRLAPLEDLVGGGSTLVYGGRGLNIVFPPTPESVWRLDGARSVQITSSQDDLQPLAVDRHRVVARRLDGTLELLDLDGGVLRTFDVPALAAEFAGDDLVLLVQGALRDYSASSGELLHAWPLPEVASSGRCRSYPCPAVRLILEDAARGVAVYTLDHVVHLLRLRDGVDRTVPGATAAELTDAGLFYAYTGDEPWPGRIRFVPFYELPLR
ncbi:MAG TPA: hypothetical protein VE596_09920 [Gaiellaceae bacterium]|nr:hypothetical protein [Gaiellaceae bacterium]